MGDYTIYKYLFNRSTEQNLFSQQTKAEALELAQEELDKAIKGELFFAKKHRSREEYERLEYQLLCSQNSISVLLINDSKHKKYQEGKEDMTLNYHPGCYVIIDNRPGIAQIAIEKTSSFDYDTDKVSKLLKTALDRTLSQVGMNIDIQPIYQSKDFWESVDEIKKKNDRITKITFHFLNSNTIGPLNATQAELVRMEFIASMMAAFDAAESKFGFTADRDKSLILDRTQEDVAAVIDLCCRNGYEIAVHFKEAGIYRTGKEIRVTRQLRDSHITDFVQGQAHAFHPYGFLGEWLDSIHETRLSLTSDHAADK